jgi:hypothetical protein
MWGIIVLFISLFMMGTTMLYTTHDHIVTSANTTAAAITDNIKVYRQHVIAYAQAHPSISGVIPEASLGLPSWYSKTQDMGNYVESGKGYVYYTGHVPGIKQQMFKAFDYSVKVGIKHGPNFINALGEVHENPFTFFLTLPDDTLIVVA